MLDRTVRQGVQAGLDDAGPVVEDGVGTLAGSPVGLFQAFDDLLSVEAGAMAQARW